MNMNATLRLDPDGLADLLGFAAELDLSDPAAAAARLEERFPFQGDFVQSIGAAMRAGVQDGSICHMGEAPVQFSRLFKATDESRGISADAVLMSAPGPRQAHPNGEIDLCFAERGEPQFDGQPPGWTVYPPGSRHVPTVAGGEMLILYLLPGGAIEFLKD